MTRPSRAKLGVSFGRPRKLTAQDELNVCELRLWMSVEEIAEKFEVSRGTIDLALKPQRRTESKLRRVARECAV